MSIETVARPTLYRQAHASGGRYAELYREINVLYAASRTFSAKRGFRYRVIGLRHMGQLSSRV
jgi:hypothetical protein